MSLPDWLVVFCAVPIVIVIWLLLSFVVGGTVAAFVSVFLSLGALAFWRGDAIANALKQTRSRQTPSNVVATDLNQLPSDSTNSSALLDIPPPPPIPSQPGRSSKSNEAEVATQVTSDELFVLQTSTPLPTRRPVSSSNSNPIRTIKNWFAGPAEADVEFYGKDSHAEVDGRVLREPLIYLLKGKLQNLFDASLIETDLPVASRSHGANRLPYWPSFRDCNRAQRRKYLDWLVSGRRDSGMELGYVFIYFYGLERRVMIDREDFVPIIEELLQLYPLHKYSRSFQRYSTSLLWMAILFASKAGVDVSQLLMRVVDIIDFWSDDNLAAIMSIYHNRQIPLPARVAYLVAEHDPRSPRSVVTKRHPEKFRELFEVRYAEQFGNGIQLSAAKRDHRISYHPASPTLLNLGTRADRFEMLVPNVPGISSQFKPILAIWNSSIDDLKRFSRTIGQFNVGVVPTAEVYESLPVELRQDDHPDSEKWYEIINRHTGDSGWALVPIREFATVKDIEKRKRLTKRQCESLLATADCMALCFEPDSRETAECYQWDDVVSVFPREQDGEENLQSYHAASILLRLGLSIAAADGIVDAKELDTVTGHLESQFELSTQESCRLEHLAHLLCVHPTDSSRLAKKMSELPDSKRMVVGKFLISVAAADEVITAEETAALKKMFRSLNLDIGEIDRLAVGGVAVDGAPDAEQVVVLDHSRIQEILAETRQVSELLQNVMIGEDEMSAGSPASVVEFAEASAVPEPAAASVAVLEAPEMAAGPANQDDTKLTGLNRRYHSFASELLMHQRLGKDDALSIAQKHSVILGGAIEVINEWSLEQVGDWLVEESGDELLIHAELIE